PHEPDHAVPAAVDEPVPRVDPVGGRLQLRRPVPVLLRRPVLLPAGRRGPRPPPQPVTNVTNLIVTTPEQPPELRVRLNLNGPPNAKVVLAGKDVDTAAQPLVLESPVLKEGQKYTFDVKVSWREGDKTEERARVVAVDAGESKTLTYLTVK